MATEWYYQVGGQARGPVGPKELMSKVREGVILPNTLIQKDDSQWVEASEVNGLIDAAHKDRKYGCPFCAEPIPKPPVTCRNCAHWVDFTENITDPDHKKEDSGDSEKSPKGVKKVAKWVRSLMTDD